MNGNASTTAKSLPMAINNSKKIVSNLTNLKKQTSWQEDITENDIDVPGTPRTPRTSTTPGKLFLFKFSSECGTYSIFLL